MIPALGLIYWGSGHKLAPWMPYVMIISACMYPVTTKLSRLYRYRSGADDFGMMNNNDYVNMSGPEKKEFDKIRRMEMERLVPSTTIEKATKKGPAKPDDELNKLIGLYAVKDKVMEIAARAEFDKANKKSGKKAGQGQMSGHYVFYGAPGTGKTTVARILTSYLYKNGCIKQNRCIEIDGNSLKGAAPGEGAMKTEIYVRKAFGGVLFVDEAYSMADGNMRSECVDTLIKMMEDYKDRFVLILAGYPVPMEVLLDSNPGFKSRVRDYVWFPDYDVESAKEIFIKMSSGYGLSVTEEALGRFGEIYLEEMKKPDFGNARTVRNILDHSISCHALNYKRKTSKQRNLLEEQDITAK